MDQPKDLFPAEDEPKPGEPKKVPDWKVLGASGLFKSKRARLIIALGAVFFAYSLVARHQASQTTQQKLVAKQRAMEMGNSQPSGPDVGANFTNSEAERARQAEEDRRAREKAEKLKNKAHDEAVAAEREYERQKHEGERSNQEQTLATIPQPSPAEERRKRLEQSLGSDTLLASFRHKRTEVTTAELAGHNASNDAAPTPEVDETKEHPATQMPGENAAKPASRILAENRADGRTYILPESTVIEATLGNRLAGELPSQVIAVISQNVWSRDGQHMLIPRGTRMIGESKPVSTLDQKRLAIAFHRAIMPDLYSLSLDQFAGLDQIGQTGLRDRVNQHWAQIFGASLAVGALGALAQVGQGSYGGLQGYDTGTQMRNGITASMGQSADRIMERFMNVMPTVTIREGTRIKVILAGDLAVPEYGKHRMEDTK